MAERVSGRLALLQCCITTTLHPSIGLPRPHVSQMEHFGDSESGVREMNTYGWNGMGWTGTDELSGAE